MKESRSLSALKDSIDCGEKVILHEVGMKIQKPASFWGKEPHATRRPSLQKNIRRVFFGVFRNIRNYLEVCLVRMLNSSTPESSRT